ncbi:MAG: hypothetical protein COA86_07280 [Kangiella sp.]|nr:MAG: hypothetical protein COA86_07280 [Kangiella sp.]
MLIEANGAVVDKRTILSQVWDGVLIDDQVIFQSIKELMKVDFIGSTIEISSC